MAQHRVVPAASDDLTLARAVYDRLLLAGWREHEAADVACQDASVKEHRSLHDDLTGLPNRTLFGNLVQEAIGAARTADGKLAVLMLDLNGFTMINARLGHAAGDHLLQQVADRLRSMVGAADTAARFGGDAFAFLLATTDGVPQAVQAARRVLHALAAPYTLYGSEQHLAARIGIALYPQHGTEARELLKQADTAHDAAKRNADGYALAGVDRDRDGRLSVSALRAGNKQVLLSCVRETQTGGRLGGS